MGLKVLHLCNFSILFEYFKLIEGMLTTFISALCTPIPLFLNSYLASKLSKGKVVFCIMITTLWSECFTVNINKDWGWEQKLSISHALQFSVQVLKNKEQ